VALTISSCRDARHLQRRRDPPREAAALGRRIQHLRKLKKLSQEQLAERAMMHRVYLGGVEQGRRNPSLKHLANVARALGVKIVDLFLTDNN
jgi:transcriptional regulator with XRE-family HTH domain